jgi:hypothetical protein
MGLSGSVAGSAWPGSRPRARATVAVRPLAPLGVLSQGDQRSGDHRPERPDVHAELVGGLDRRRLLLVHELDGPVVARVA